MRAATAAGVGQRQIAAIQRSRMLTALAQVACDEGIANVTVAKIVDRASVSRRTFYEEFSDIGECLLAVLERSLDEARERVLPAWESASPVRGHPEGRKQASWRGQVRAGLGELLLFFDEQPDVACLLVVQWVAAGPPAAEQRRRLLEQLAGVVRQGGRSGEDPEQAEIAAEAVVGGVFAILHARLTEPAERTPHAGAGERRPNGHPPSRGAGRLAELTSPLMSMIVLPHLGRAAARAELSKPAPVARRESAGRVDNPLKHVDLRLTQRTAAVIAAVASGPGRSNRALGEAAGIVDQGQISKLLMRLARLGLLVNDNAGNHRVSGAPNAWRLTGLGEQVARSLRLDGSV